MRRKRLGVVTDGAFNAGLTVRLDPGVSTESLRIGDFVIVEGEEYLYFSAITDLELRATDARVQADPPPDDAAFLREVLQGTATYATVQVKPYLMMRRVSPAEPLAAAEAALVGEEGSRPVKTIPMHFAVLCEAREEDFAAVFGAEDEAHFAVGTPLTQDIPICLDLRRFVERSNGIFGQSGTGKSFLARLLLAGIIAKGLASNLIFDMHNEYAYSVQREGGGWAKGLREIFGPSSVLVYSLDERASRQEGRAVDGVLRLGLNQIEAEDVLLLGEELDLTSTAQATAGLLQDRYGEDWLRALLEMGAEAIQAFCAETNAHPGANAKLAVSYAPVVHATSKKEAARPAARSAARPVIAIQKADHHKAEAVVTKLPTLLRHSMNDFLNHVAGRSSNAATHASPMPRARHAG